MEFGLVGDSSAGKTENKTGDRLMSLDIHSMCRIDEADEFKRIHGRKLREGRVDGQRT